MSKNINIRAITFSVDIFKINDNAYQKKVKNIVNSVNKHLNDKYLIRTLRINIIKIKPQEIQDENLFIQQVKLLSDFCKSLNIRWFNLCFDMTYSNKKQSVFINSLTIRILKKIQNAFINWIVCDKKNVNKVSSFYAGKCIIDISKLSYNGYDNFRFGVNLNPNSGTPFFPFSFSENEFKFSIALELTNYISEIINSNNESKSLKILKEKIIESLNEKINNLNHEIYKIDNIKDKFEGFDCSLAPFPNTKTSVTKIYKNLFLDEFGTSGSVFLTNFLTSIIKELDSSLKYCGFNGVMFSLLEDHDMCLSNNKKLISLDNILLNSCVCGCGLDMIPIPGNSLNEEISSIILDTSILSIKLNKPLGVRLLPIPTKEQNDFTEFDMDFITNTRILPLKNLSLDYEFF